VSQIAGLQDFRQEGPPADIGAFQFPTGAMVFQHIFAGTTYICAIRAGVRGWILIDYGADARTVIQSAVNAVHDVFVAAGLYVLSGEILLNTYNTLRGEGIDVTILQMANGVFENCITAFSKSYVFVRHLTVDGLYPTNARQGAPAGEDECHQCGVVFRETSDGAIEHVKAINCPWNAIALLGDSKRNLLFNCEVDNTGWHGIELWGTPPGALEYPEYNDIYGCRVTNTTVTSFVLENNAYYNTIIASYADTAANNQSLYISFLSYENRVIGNRFQQVLRYDSVLHGGIINDNILVGGIDVNDTDDIIITDNELEDNIDLNATCDKIIIKDNNLRAGTIVVAAGATRIRIEDNEGYNPKGNIPTPYPVAAGYLTDSAAAQAFPTSNTNYTITESPKFITIYGGTVTSISIDGVATGLTSGSFFLKTGQILNVVWTGQPSSQVYAV